MDIMGPLPLASGGARFVLHDNDYFIKWVEPQAYASINTIEVIKFIQSNILKRFGIPRIIMTNKGKQLRHAKITAVYASTVLNNVFT